MSVSKAAPPVRPDLTRIAIIGAGMAGCATAWFLRQALGDTLILDIYEKNDRVGGRAAIIDMDGVAMEAGGAIIHETNRYLSGFIDLLGLERIAPTDDLDQGGSVGIWDGSGLVFRTHPSLLRTRLSALKRYGLLSPLRTQSLVKHTVTKWNAIYAHLEAGKSFQDPQSLLAALGLDDLPNQTGRAWLEQAGVKPRFIAEYASPVGRIMYGQSAAMHAFATAIALAGAGMAGKLFSVGGGNFRICAGLIDHAGARLHLSTPISAIGKNQDGRMTLQAQNSKQDTYDVIVLATPDGPAGLEISGITVAPAALTKRPFQTTWTTLIKGRARPACFGFERASDLPDIVLTTENPSIPFSSLGLMDRAPDGTPLYKIFSRQRPDPALLDTLFERIDLLKSKCWQAYPVLEPARPLPPFEPGERLFWVNAMEFAVSTMETETVAARNVSNRIIARLRAQ